MKKQRFRISIKDRDSNETESLRAVFYVKSGKFIGKIIQEIALELEKEQS